MKSYSKGADLYRWLGSSFNDPNMTHENSYNHKNPAINWSSPQPATLKNL